MDRLVDRGNIVKLLMATIFAGLFTVLGAGAALAGPPVDAVDAEMVAPAPGETESGERPPLSGGAPIENPVFTPRERLEQGGGVNAASPTDGPTLEIWYGDSQQFGSVGQPIRWINIVGRVTPARNVTLSYSLNSGPFRPLDIGSTKRRLYDAGDFNVELCFVADASCEGRPVLNNGENTLVVRAVDTLANQTQATISIQASVGQEWPLPFVADWADAQAISDVAQPVDGLWQLDGSAGTIQPIQIGYDRLISIGSINWQEYEVTVPVTILSIDEGGFNGTSIAPAIGLILRWRGHFCWDETFPTGPDAQLCNGWQQLGSLDWFTWAQENGGLVGGLQRVGAQGGVKEDVTPQFGVPYLMKAQVVTDSGCLNNSRYRFRVWPQGTAEPQTWNMDGCDSNFGGQPSPAAGSFLLVAHHTDALFGPVTVTAPNVGRPTFSATSASNGAVAHTPDYPDYTYLEKVTVTATPVDGYAFAGWSGDVTSTDNPLVLELTEDTSIVANFVEADFVLDVTVLGEGSVSRSPDLETYGLNALVQLTAVPSAGWAFDGWSGDLNSQAMTTTIAMDGDKSVTATFVQEHYTIDVSVVDEEGVETPAAGAVNVSPPNDALGYVLGEVAVLNAAPSTGWRFVEWRLDASGTAASTSVTVDADMAVEAVFARQPVNLVVAVNGGGFVSKVPDSSGIYQYGDEVTLTAVNLSGWRFLNWSGDVQSGDTSIVVLMDGDKSISANFGADGYLLNTESLGEGTVVAEPQVPDNVYAPLQFVTVRAVPDGGWAFDRWEGRIDGNQSTQNPLIVQMDSDLTLTAVFTELETVFLPIVRR